ncbi:MAG: nucleoside 2-deoxyribosyltransferase domain-containing protein, partial [Bacteroidia bacterium]
TMLEEALNKTDVTIFNPRRLDFDPKAKYKSDNPYMVQQIKWELSHLDKADIIVFYFDPNGEAPITLYEMGRVSRDVSELKKKGLIYCPEGYWKKANVDVNGEYDFFNFAETEEELIEFLKQMIKGDL